MKTNILFISSYLARNGTEAFIMNVFRHLDKSKFNIDFMIFSKDNIAYEEEIVSSGAKIYCLHQRKKNVFLYYKDLFNFFRLNKGKYHVVHWCITSFSSLAPIIFAYRAGVPVRILHSHNSNCRGIHNKILHRLFRPVANSLATCKMACSEYAANWCFGNSKAMIIRNGIETEMFNFNLNFRSAKRAELKISGNTCVVGHVGRFDPVKNHKKLISIFIEFLKLNQDSLLCLIGKGKLRKEIEELAKKYNIYDKILFLGERSDVNRVLQAIDIFVMPSVFEGLPYVLIEAQASGLPCVVSDTTDNTVKITPGLHFLSLTQSDVEWAGYIFELYKKYHRESTQKYIVDAGYSIEETVKVLESLYLS